MSQTQPEYSYFHRLRTGLKLNPRASHRWLSGGLSLLWMLMTVMWLGLSAPAWAESTQASEGPQTLALSGPTVPQPGAQNFVTAALDRIGDTVVRIDTERTVVHPSVDPFSDDPFMREFFGSDLFPQAPREDRLRGQGSGFIIDGTGIILTNAHVVNRADTVTVTIKDGRTFKGTVTGVDEVSDLAVVKLNGVKEPLPVAPLGNSDQIHVGDWAIAVGNPVGLDNTVTLGIVSTLHRTSAEVGMPSKRLEFIQTDAAINPGNSGGPLLSDRGEVIGINTAIRADAMGIGFAIPINKAKSLKDRLVKGEEILHPYVGVQMTTLTPELARENNRDPNSPTLLPEIQGVLVMQVFPDTPAAAAGIRSGDVIMRVDGQSVTEAGQLQTIVENSEVGQQLQLMIKRGGQTQQIAVRTAELQSTT